MSTAKTLHLAARLDRYEAQNNGGPLTARQARRVTKKARKSGELHEVVEAARVAAAHLRTLINSKDAS